MPCNPVTRFYTHTCTSSIFKMLYHYKYYVFIIGLPFVLICSTTQLCHLGDRILPSDMLQVPNQAVMQTMQTHDP